MKGNLGKLPIEGVNLQRAYLAEIMERRPIRIRSSPTSHHGTARLPSPSRTKPRRKEHISTQFLITPHRARFQSAKAWNLHLSSKALFPLRNLPTLRLNTGLGGGASAGFYSQRSNLLPPSGLQMGQRIKRWISCFHIGQPCFSHSCRY